MAIAFPSFLNLPKLWRTAAPLRRGMLSLTKGMCVWFVPMFITAASTAYLSYKYNQKSNTELAIQQQTFSDLQAFRNSGADLDQALGVLSDAIIDGADIDAARSIMRNSISRHISDALANDKSLGPEATSYIEALGRLRVTVDDVDPSAVETGLNLWEQSLEIMSRRRKLVSAAQLRAAQQ